MAQLKQDIAQTRSLKATGCAVNERSRRAHTLADVYVHTLRTSLFGVQ